MRKNFVEVIDFHFSFMNNFKQKNFFLIKLKFFNNNQGTINNWCNFIKKFTVPSENEPDIWSINDYPLLIINLCVNEDFYNKKICNLYKNLFFFYIEYFEFQ